MASNAKVFDQTKETKKLEALLTKLERKSDSIEAKEAKLAETQLKKGRDALESLADMIELVQEFSETGGGKDKRTKNYKLSQQLLTKATSLALDLKSDQIDHTFVRNQLNDFRKIAIDLQARTKADPKLKDLLAYTEQMNEKLTDKLVDSIDQSIEKALNGAQQKAARKTQRLAKAGVFSDLAKTGVGAALGSVGLGGMSSYLFDLLGVEEKLQSGYLGNAEKKAKLNAKEKSTGLSVNRLQRIKEELRKEEKDYIKRAADALDLEISPASLTGRKPTTVADIRKAREKKRAKADAGLTLAGAIKNRQAKEDADILDFTNIVNAAKAKETKQSAFVSAVDFMRSPTVPSFSDETIEEQREESRAERKQLVMDDINKDFMRASSESSARQEKLLEDILSGINRLTMVTAASGAAGALGGLGDVDLPNGGSRKGPTGGGSRKGPTGGGDKKGMLAAAWEVTKRYGGKALDASKAAARSPAARLLGRTASRLAAPLALADSIWELGSGMAKEYKTSDEVHKAIKFAAQTTGVPEGILSQKAFVESHFKPDARGGKGSTAKGLFQILDGTWKEIGTKMGGFKMLEQYGLPNDPFNASANALFGALYTKHNQEQLQKLGVNATPGALYAAHFLGTTGASKLFRADDSDTAFLVFREASRRPNNRTIFYDPSNGYRPRTIGEMKAHLYSLAGDSYNPNIAMAQASGSSIMDPTPMAGSRKAEQAFARPAAQTSVPATASGRAPTATTKSTSPATPQHVALGAVMSANQTIASPSVTQVPPVATNSQASATFDEIPMFVDDLGIMLITTGGLV